MKLLKRKGIAHFAIVLLSVFFFVVIITQLGKIGITGFLTFQDTTSGNFNAGTFNNTSFNGSYVSLNASNITGLFTSRVFNESVSVASWDNITWVEGVPYGENLPDRGAIANTTENVLGGANMTGNIMLLHLDDSSGTIATDSSGLANNGVAPNATWQAGILGNAHNFNISGSFIKINASNQNNLTSTFTIELWIKGDALNRSSQTLVSKWEAGSGNFTHNISTAATLPSWQVMDTATLNSNFKQYYGGAFDGRYVYFVPSLTTIGNVIRYDTTGNFTANVSTAATLPTWQVMDISTLNSTFKGYRGAVFDGRYVYFIPNNNGAKHGNILRYDTTGNFTANVSNSWQHMNISELNPNFASYDGGIFDGRYVYFVPFDTTTTYHGNIVRYDTTGTFNSNLTDTKDGTPSWQVMNASQTLGNADFIGYSSSVFDGRFVYFVPYTLTGGEVLRYDTTGNFTNNLSNSWQVMDTDATLNSNFRGFGSGVFDGRYVYFIPTNIGSIKGNVLRYDTTGNFTNNKTDTVSGTTSWQVMDMATMNGNFVGKKGAAFDGRYVYFVPGNCGAFCLGGTGSGFAVRYDTTGNFTHNRTTTASGNPSWQVMDTITMNSNFKLYAGAVFDGRYVYLMPNGEAVLGKIVRYDSGRNASYSLEYSTSGAGGLDGRPFGLTVRIANNTNHYALSLNNNTFLNASGWHHIAATYDGNNLTIFIDGKNISSMGAPGSIQASDADLIIGAMTSPGTNNTTSSWLNGTIDEVAIFNRSLSAAEILNHFKRGLTLNATARTSADNVTFTEFRGASNSTTAFTNATLSSLSSHTSTQYIQYQFAFDSIDGNYSVELYNATISYTLTTNTAPQVTFGNATNATSPSSNPITYITAIDPEQASLYVEIISNFSTANISYGMQQNNTATSRVWNNATVTDGIYIYYARAYDNNSNNVTEGNSTLIVDTTKPTVNASAQMHINATVFNNSWVANFTIAENLFYTNYSIEINSVNYTSTGNLSTAAGLHSLYITRTFTLSTGNVTAKAYANDSAGNEQFLGSSWINYQANVPTITVNAPANNSTIASTFPNITVTITDAEQLTTYAEVYANGSNKSYALVQNNTQTNLTWNTTSQGIYDYYVRAYDNVSNGVTSANRTIILDTTAPTIINVSISPINVTVTNNSAHVFNFSITDNIYLENTSIELNNTANGTAVNYSFTKDSAQFNFTINFSALANNNYTIIVYANDSGGNSVRFSNNWLNVNVAASGGGGETGGGEPSSGGGGGYNGPSPTISVDNRNANIPNAQKETEVFITIPITKNGIAATGTYRAVISDIVSSSANVRFGPLDGQLKPAITLNPGQEAFIDLNGDGVNDVKVTLNSVAKGLADITFDVIVKPRGTGINGPTIDELLEEQYGEEGAAGARELIVTRLLAYSTIMVLLAVVFVIRYIPETFGLKRKKRD